MWLCMYRMLNNVSCEHVLRVHVKNLRSFGGKIRPTSPWNAFYEITDCISYCWIFNMTEHQRCREIVSEGLDKGHYTVAALRALCYRQDALTNWPLQPTYCAEQDVWAQWHLGAVARWERNPWRRTVIKCNCYFRKALFSSILFYFRQPRSPTRTSTWWWGGNSQVRECLGAMPSVVKAHAEAPPWAMREVDRPSRNPENGWRTRAATGGMESLTIPKTNVIQHV